MTTNGLSAPADSNLLGVEIGRNKVRLAIVDRASNQLGDAVERPIAKAGGPRDPIEQEFSTRSAIEAGLDRLDVDRLSGLTVGATIGFPNCGVGSGPALADWLESLSDELDEPIIYTGRSGISYAPASCVEFVQRVFEPLGLQLNRVELAPVAAARVISSVRSGAITLGSGVSWSARLLNNQVLEAFESADGSFDDDLQVVINGIGESIPGLDGYRIGDSITANRGLTASALAPAVGVAVALLDPEGPNLLVGSHAGASGVGAAEAVYGADTVVDDGHGQAGWNDHAAVQTHEPETLSEPPPIDAHVRDPELQPFEAHTDDLGSIQNELRAHRSSDDTYRLRMPRTIERSRELRSAPPARDDGYGGPVQASAGGFDRVEAFAHPAEPTEDGGFRVSDFLLGALLMLALVLLAALVIL